MDDRSWIVDWLGATAFERLASGLSGSELQSVLLEVMRHRARVRRPAEILAQYARDGFCRPSPIDQRTSVAVDAHLLAAADGFEAIELPPAAPLGACSAVAPTHQNRVLSALRSTEITSDPSNVLALECAVRLRAGRGPSHLATSQRVLDDAQLATRRDRRHQRRHRLGCKPDVRHRRRSRRGLRAPRPSADRYERSG